MRVAETAFNMLNVDSSNTTHRAPRTQTSSAPPQKYAAALEIASTKDPAPNGCDELKPRIEELPQQCGFSTDLFAAGFTIDDDRRKVELLVNGRMI